MNPPDAPSEYLVISRGQWDKDLPPETIQAAIDQFYIWLEKKVEAGQMIKGQRLATGGATVSKKGVMDGPYGETKEVIGGYWFVLAGNLQAAVEILAENPCVQCGLLFEIRPIETERASAYAVTNETPD
ncbi:hypothetical protein EI77_02647 [Prosthecobacter fusiformis]|uniref:YCII-related domain-containing protein n=1 Tax=Prosthecobacter fusiformis TaxID=48464 RepID=A0A4R7RXM6_9BACT|nr:YciI family protein [Prosthecobacter fusiformis]TDU70600.1 hypothetical protein EI77_02647 [Prosthecobacter fusiformis]